MRRRAFQAWVTAAVAIRAIFISFPHVADVIQLQYHHTLYMEETHG